MRITENLEPDRYESVLCKYSEKDKLYECHLYQLQFEPSTDGTKDGDALNNLELLRKFTELELVILSHEPFPKIPPDVAKEKIVFVEEVFGDDIHVDMRPPGTTEISGWHKNQMILICRVEDDCLRCEPLTKKMRLDR